MGHEADEPANGRQRLLDAVVEFVTANGVGDRSLRGLAEAIGTSHRMLIYHFGSREGLLVEVIKAMEHRQRDLLAELTQSDAGTQSDSATLAGLGRSFWARVSDPALWPHERLFFEMYGRALQGDPAAAPMLDRVIDTWIEPLAEVFRRSGVPPDQVRARARLGVAVARGLLLDLLATGDRAGVDEAMEQFIALNDELPAIVRPSLADPV